MKKTRIKKRELFGRIMAIVISLIMLVGMFPFTIFASETADADPGLSLDDFNNPKGNVNDYSTSENPYGYGDGQTFTMSTQDELFNFVSYDMNNEDEATSIAMIYSKFKRGDVNDNDIAKAQMSRAPLLALESGNLLAGAPFESAEFSSPKKPGINTLYHMQSIAFDPYNTGHNDHIAIVGVGVGGTGMLYVMNANTQEILGITVLGTNSQLVGNNTQAFQGSNFLAITAGRYSTYDEKNPKGETIVAYFPDLINGPTLYEFSLDSSGELSMLSSGTTLLHKDYINGSYGKGMQEKATEGINNALAVSLATGDFDGDRVDDLAVLSSITDPHKDYKNISYQYYMPELFVAYGGGSDTVLNNSSKKQEIAIWNDDNTEMRTFTSPSVAAGDLDGDGTDNVLAAGWQLKVVKENANSAKTKEYKIESGVVFGAWSGTDKKLSKIVLKNYDEVDAKNETGKITNNWTEEMKQDGDDNFNDSGNSFPFPRYCIEAVAINGDGAADYIFMNGTFCKFDVSEGLKYVFTPEYFQHDDSSVEGTDTNVQYIASAAVGVFDHNTVGREQIAVSVGLKEKGADDYFFMLGTMGGYDFADIKDSDGSIKEYGAANKIFTTSFDRSAHGEDEYDYGQEGDYLVFNRGNSTGQYLNCMVCAVDTGDDGVLARYKTKDLIYSDPNVVAVLQAAPYFSELDGTVGETSYTIGTEYTIGEMSSNSTSFSIGVSAELEGPGIKVAAGSGYTSTWSESFDSSVTESYSTSFTATENNQVILQRTPIVVYTYEVKYAGKEWDKNTIQVSIPAGPIYMTLTVDEYNKYVKDFNIRLRESDPEYEGDRLKPLNSQRLNSASLLGNEGNPEKYISAWTEVTGKNLSNSVYGVSANDTGNITSEYSASTSEQRSEEKSDGFYVNASIGSGASFLLGSAYVGVDTSVEGEWTIGSYTTTTNYKTVSGTVTNLGGVRDIPDNVRTQYGFSWTFGRWTIWLDNDNPGIPVYGYQVSSVRRPAPAPINLLANDGVTADEVILSWDAVQNASGYVIYSYDVAGNRDEIGRIEPASGTPETSFTYPINTRAPYYTFSVSALKNGVEGAVSDKYLYYPNTNASVGKDGITPQLRINANSNEWEVSYDGGLSWASLGVKATGENGIDGTPGANGEDGKNGANGKDGITPQFQINSETNEWEISYDEGVTWATLGVVATGDKGMDGIDGITPQLRINLESNMWEASYDNGTTWSSLNVTATGATGKAGTDGRELELQTTEKYIQWRYAGETVWQNLLTLADITGVDGTNGAKGENGTNGREIELQTTSSHIQWRYIDETEWQNLIALTEITGTNGKDGTDGKDGVNGTNGKDGKDGLNGVDGKDGANGTNSTVTAGSGITGSNVISGANGKDGKDGLNGADGIDGKDGSDGRGIEGIEINKNGEFIFTMTDGTTINAGKVPEYDSSNPTEVASNSTAIAAYIALAVSGVSLLWNIVALIIALTKKR